MSTITIHPYEPQYAVHFEKLNRAWIEKEFVLEAPDIFVLQHPEEAIINKGGEIYFACLNGQVVATAGLLKKQEKVFELVKMTVAESARGMGIGKLLCKAAIEGAKKKGAATLILYSNTRQSAAINMYRQLGFTELAVEDGIYERANIKMELPLKDKLSIPGIKALVESYGNAYVKIKACIDSIPKSIWQWQPPYNKWTIHQNIIHLADTEVNSYFRCRRFIAEPGSTVLGYNQDAWANSLWYHRQNVDDALDLFRLARKMTYHLIRELPDEMWERSVEHTENGTMKLWQWLRYYENHTHIFQMQRVYNEWQKAQRIKTGNETNTMV